MGSVSSPRALPIYIFTLAHGFIPLLDTPLCVPPWAKRPMIAHTYHNKECSVLGKHPIYLIYDSGHTNIPQVLEIWPNIPIYLMQAGQQSKYQYTSPTHVITIRYVIDMEYTRCDRIGRF